MDRQKKRSFFSENDAVWGTNSNTLDPYSTIRKADLEALVQDLITSTAGRTMTSVEVKRIRKLMISIRMKEEQENALVTFNIEHAFFFL